MDNPVHVGDHAAKRKRGVIGRVSKLLVAAGLIAAGSTLAFGPVTDAAYIDQDFAQPSTAISVQTRQVLTTVETGTYAGYGRLPDKRWLAWGDRRFGGGVAVTELSRLNDITETPALAGNTFEKIYSGDKASFGIDNQGIGYFWGTNTDGLFGNGSAVTARFDLPQRGLTSGSLAGKRLASMCVASDGAMAIDTTGGLHSWGVNTSGRLGLGTLSAQSVPALVTALSGKVITACVLTQSHALAIDSSGTLYAWGLGSSGQLGIGSALSSSLPIAVSGLTKVVQIAASAGYSVALDAEGSLFSWGNNRNGQLGLGLVSTDPYLKPVRVNDRGALASLKIKQIDTVSGSVTFALATNGVLYSWGSDFTGGLAQGPVSSSTPEPTPIERATSSLAGAAIDFVSCGSGTCIALDTNGYAHAWGYAGYYLFGNGSSVTTGLTQAAVL
nr:hypothetical protein [Lysinibacter cavernae]